MWKLFFLLSKICIILRFFNLCISTYHKHLLRGEGPLIMPNYLFFSDQIDRPFQIQQNIKCILCFVFYVCSNHMSFYIWHFLNEPQSTCVNKWSTLHRWGCPPWRNILHLLASLSLNNQLFFLLSKYQTWLVTVSSCMVARWFKFQMVSKIQVLICHAESEPYKIWTDFNHSRSEWGWFSSSDCIQRVGKRLVL